VVCQAERLFGNSKGFGRVVLLLAGGDKSTQPKDIEKATTLLNELED